MYECFPLRFNLDECAAPKSDDQALAIAAMFKLEPSYVRACAEQFSKRVGECVDRLDALLCERLKEKYAGKQVAFFGDSITSDKLGYARIAARVLPQTKNYAVSCSTSANVLKNLKNLDGEPHTAILFIGTNDASQTARKTMVGAAEYKKNLGAIFSLLQICERRIVFTLPGGAEYSDAVRNRFNRVVRHAARRYECDILDMTEFAREYGYEPDGVHLSEKAQEETARRLLRLLDKTNE